MSKQSRLNKEKAAKAKASQGNTGSNANSGADKSKNYNNDMVRHPEKSDDMVNRSREGQ